MMRFFSKKWHRFTDLEKKSEPEAINESTTTKLTDINDDCLEHIFLYLNIEDLVNIAYTSKQLKPAAESAFSSNFGRKKMLIEEFSHGRIHIYDYKQRLSRNQFHRLMSSFGHLILKIKLSDFKTSSLKKVNQFGCKSITDLRFYEMDLHRMKKPFHAAETVAFFNVNTNWFCNPLNKLFPNVRTLDINYGHIWPWQIEVQFPHLNQLNISFSASARNRSYANMMRMNSQVQSLVLRGKPCAKYLRYASKHLKFLERLQIVISNQNDLNDFDNFGEDVNFTFLKELKIILTTNRYMKTVKIPIVSNNLKEFTFHLASKSGDGNRKDNVNILIDFFKKCPSLTKVTLSRCWNVVMPINKEIIIEIADALPSIESINISMLKISFNVAIEFVKYCKRLKKLCFVIENDAGFIRLQDMLAPEWHAVSVKSETMYHITIVKRHTSIEFIERNAWALQMCRCNYNAGE